MIKNDIDALKAVTEEVSLSSAVDVDALRHNEDSEEEFLEDGEEDQIVDGEEWVATHTIKGIPVMRKVYSGGLPYYVTVEGNKRRPTRTSPARPIQERFESAKKMYLGLAEFALVCSVLGDADAYAEDIEGNIAERIDREHVKLSVIDRVTRTHTRFIVQLPTEIEVVGKRSFN